MTTSTLHYDVLIVGAGIAGLAIAERVSREARRQCKGIKILVVDRAPMIGMGSSSGLQGWFHTGSLYTRLKSSKSYLNCAESHQILEREYANAEDFEHRLNCNTSHDQRSSRAWFGDQISFILDKSTNPAWNQQTHEITNRLQDLGGSVNTIGPVDPAQYTTLSTTDRSLKIFNIMSDLASTAAANGVDFLMNYRARGLNEINEQDPVLIESKDGPAHRVYATHTLITTGYDIPIPADVLLSRRSGIIVSASPCIDAPNIIRIAENPDNNISHIAHPTDSRNEVGFSAIGDSTTLSGNPSHHECEMTARRIVDKVRAVFGEQAFHSRTVAWHMARKIEIATQSSDARMFGPMMYKLQRNRYAVIPSKFSLFPSLAHKALNQLLDDNLFEQLIAPTTMPSSSESPTVAPMLSQRVLGITESKCPAYALSGRLICDTQSAAQIHVNSQTRVRPSFTA